jgi:hypothetical protein
MPHQGGRNIIVSYAEEVTFGVAADDSTGKVFRINGGGLNLAKAPIRSNENRRDGQMTRGRHGSRSVAGQYPVDLSLGSFDDFIEAVFRGTFDTELVLTEADFTSITTGANTIVFASGNPITLGIRVGDIIRLTNHSSSGNNNRNLRVTGVSSTTITVAETLTVNAVADTDVDLTRPRKVVMGTTPRSFTVEENQVDIDGSKLFKGVRVGQMQLALQPNGMGTLTFSLVGQDMEILTGGDAPYFVDPEATVSIGMTAVEAMIRLGSTDVLDIDSLNLTINLNADGHPVVGSNLTPDVFTNLADVQGTITALKSDMTRATAFLNETQLSLHLLFTENEAEPRDFCSFFVGNLTLASATDSDIGADGAMTESLTLMVGKDERGGAYEASTVVYQTSAAA